MTNKVSQPFKYQGYSEKTYSGWARYSEYVEMSDGARIAADIYLPQGYLGSQLPPSNFPVIFNFTPYMRATIDPETGEITPNILNRPGEHLADYHEYGYVLVVADTRGNGASTGAAMTFGWRYQQDAGEMIDWIAQQDWCDGNVGMVGGSHHGWTQLAAASRKPAALKAIMPAVVPLDGFTGQFFPGGIFMHSFLTGSRLSNQIMAVREATGKLVAAPVDPAAPPVPAANSEDSQADMELTYDWDNEPFIDTRARSGENGRDFCANLVGPIAETGMAIYHLGAWFDGFARGTTELYASLAESNPSRLAMFPGFHDLVRGFVYDEFGAEPPDLVAERRRFFDHYLKGIDNGIDSEPPVLIYTINGDGWRQEQEWPLSRQQVSKMYLTENLGLTESPSADNSDPYRVDLSHDRRYGCNLSSRWTALGGTPPQGAPDMTEQDRSSLCYSSAPLESDMEVTGHPIVRLWVSSDADCGDFYVFLEDVDKDGRSLLVTEGQLRAGWHNLHDNNLMTDCDIDIKPELPWHGYEKAHWDEGVLANSRVIELVIDLQPVSWLFRKGHRIRLAVTGANWPDFSLNPTLSPANDPDAADNLVPTIRVHRGGE